MAKATGGNKSSAARMRNSRNPGGWRGAADKPAPNGADLDGVSGEEMAEEMAVGMENDDMETGVDEVVESPSASAVAISSDRAVTRSATRAPARTGAPEFVLANPFTRFIWEAYQELRKVTWPRPDEAWNMTLVVIAMSLFVALMLGLADFGLAKALSFFVNLSGGH